MEFTIGIITFVYNAAIVRCGYDETGLAAYLIIGYLVLIILTVFLGMAEGLQPVFSYFSGTEETEQSDRLCRFAVRIFLAAGIMCYLLVILFSCPFFRIFNPADVALIDFAREKSLYYFEKSQDFSGFLRARRKMLKMNARELKHKFSNRL